MAWSWKIGRVSGIPIYVHWTFLILIAWLLIGQFVAGHTAARAAEEVGFVLALFGCVVLHELGHALTAKRFGVVTSDITLLPIGGVARLQRIPERPGQELLIALAGPAVNLAIVAALLAFGVRLPAGAGDARELVEAHFWPKLLLVNFFLAAFNMLPAFPMDGGRVLRALLALRLDYARATRLAASVGQLMAIVFALVGLMGNPILLLIAMFVWIGAESEAAAVEERVVLRDVKVREAMMTEFHSLAPDDTLGRAADVLLSGTQHDFPVLDEDRHAGVLTRSDLLAGLARAGRDARVGDHVKTDLPRVDAGSPLVPAVTKLREGGQPCLLVVENDREVGLLTLENVGEFLMVRSALASAPRAPAGASLVRS
jgi:Zn-dependent protease/predicted transcriptional regulator